MRVHIYNDIKTFLLGKLIVCTFFLMSILELKCLKNKKKIEKMATSVTL